MVERLLALGPGKALNTNLEHFPINSNNQNF
jgi:hypothetical protein